MGARLFQGGQSPQSPGSSPRTGPWVSTLFQKGYLSTCPLLFPFPTYDPSSWLPRRTSIMGVSEGRGPLYFHHSVHSRDWMPTLEHWVPRPNQPPRGGRGG